MDIKRKSDTISSGGKKLSSFGKVTAAAVCILLAAIIVFAVVAVNNSKAKKEKMKDLENAVSYAIQTCKNSVAGNSDALSEIEKYAKDIEKAKKADKKVELALEAIQYTLGKTTSTQAIDELNGSRNRVNVAYRNYQS